MMSRKVRLKRLPAFLESLIVVRSALGRTTSEKNQSSISLHSPSNSVTDGTHTIYHVAALGALDIAMHGTASCDTKAPTGGFLVRWSIGQGG
jgi:hypothetical protein